MDSAKQHVKEFLHGSGKHTADLKTTHAAPVTHETVQQQETHNQTKAIDREVHETHHQTTVQPVHDREVKATEHHHNVLPVESHHQHHGRDDHVKEKLNARAAEFSDKRVQAGTQQVQGENATLAGEHHHHHIHQTVQPVIDKETIQPHVVHTTVPVHERVDVEPIVHKADVAAPMSMGEFKRNVGVGKDTHETLNYTGNPLSIGKDARVGFDGAGTGGTGLTGGQGMTGTHGSSHSGGMTGSHGTSNTGNTSTGPHSSSLMNKLDPRVDSDRDGKRGVETGSGQHSSGGGVQSMVTGNEHSTGSNIGRDTTGRTGGGMGSGLTGDRDTTHGHNTRSGQLGHVTDTDRNNDGIPDRDQMGGSRSMPGGFGNDNTSGSGIPRTAGSGVTGSGTQGGFIDGKSQHDTATGHHGTDQTKDDKEGGGIISGLMNKLKS